MLFLFSGCEWGGASQRAPVHKIDKWNYSEMRFRCAHILENGNVSVCVAARDRYFVRVAARRVWLQRVAIGAMVLVTNVKDSRHTSCHHRHHRHIVRQHRRRRCHDWMTMKIKIKYVMQWEMSDLFSIFFRFAQFDVWNADFILVRRLFFGSQRIYTQYIVCDLCYIFTVRCNFLYGTMCTTNTPERGIPVAKSYSLRVCVRELWPSLWLIHNHSQKSNKNTTIIIARQTGLIEFLDDWLAGAWRQPIFAFQPCGCVYAAVRVCVFGASTRRRRSLRRMQ